MRKVIAVLAALIALSLLGCGGGTSQSLNQPPPQPPANSSNPVPVIVGTTQNCAQAGGQTFSMSVYGSNFVSSSVVRWNGSNRPTTFDNSGQLSAQISASDVAAPGTAAVTVFTPAPGGGSSNTLMLAIAAGGVSPRSFVVEPAGNFAYVANAGCPNAFAGWVSMYKIDLSTGLLQYIGAVKAGTASETVATDPTGNFTYVTDEFSNDISMYTVDATSGMLIPKGTINSPGRPVSVTLHPSGKFAYVTNGCFQKSRDSVSTYMVDTTTGALTPVGTIPTGATGPSACSINVGITLDPSGTYAYVVGDGCGLDTYPGYVSMYAIDPTTGALASVGQPVGAGYCSDSVSVDHFRKFAYVTNNQDDDLSIYSIHPRTGVLTSIGTVSTGSGPTSSAVHPSANFVYVANRTSNNVSEYSVNTQTGALTFIGTIAAGLGPISITIHPSGKFAYVTNSDSNDVSMYSIDVMTGFLTLIGTVGT
jgi:6-phosphogluconolactonase (cycloisomerase 2 family)